MATAQTGPLTYWGVDDVAEAMRTALAAGAVEHTALKRSQWRDHHRDVRTPHGAVLGLIFTQHFGVT